MKRTYIFYNDASHAWMAVTKEDINKLKFKYRISSCSYIFKETIYLEEDCDAPLFLKEAKNNGWDITIKEHHKDRPDIRNLCPYDSRYI